MVERLRIRLGSLTKIFSDGELQEFIDTAITGYNLEEGKDDVLILDLALATCYLRLATDTGMFFKYQQADESVDKSMTSEAFRKLYEVLWESCRARLGIGESGQVETGKSDTFIMRKAESKENNS
uniref:Uncharacterized protein n=1 Tax=candidate division WOR-3 bacterium TaxID=2052148 RepID=A0A7C6E9A6_UNCW3